MASSPWEAARGRVESLLAERDRVLAETAAAWVDFARRQGWSASDLTLLWEGLTETLVRRYAGAGAGASRGVRDEVVAVLAWLRARIVAELARPPAHP